MIRREDLANEIAAYDKVKGELALQAEECARQGMYMAALACLFILVELTLKEGLNQISGNFAMAIREARKTDLISKEEFKLLEELRLFRNGLFHENHYSRFATDGKLLYQYSEDDTKELAYHQFAGPCLRLVLDITMPKKQQKLTENKE